MTKKMMTMALMTAFVLSLCSSAPAARLKSYFNGCDNANQYTYRLYDLPGGSQWEFRVGTDDGNIDNYTFMPEDGLFSNFQAVIVAAGAEDALSHNSTVLDPTEQCGNPNYVEVFPPDGDCPYYIKFTFTASGDAGKRHIVFDHPGRPHPVGNTLIGPWEQSTAWSFGLGGDNRSPGGPSYGPASARIGFESETSSQAEAAGQAQITVVVDNADETATYAVDYAATGGTAENGVDYTLAQGTLTFDPGETSKTIDIDITDDGQAEDDESIELTLLALTSGDGMIVGDMHIHVIEDPRPGVAFETAEAGDIEETSPALIPVVLAQAMDEQVVVDYELTGGTATNGVDYMPLPAQGTLTFEPGETTKTIDIAVIDDGLEEDPETVILTLTNHPASVKFGITSQHTYTISDPFYVDLQVDLALPQCADGGGTVTMDPPVEGTLKEGWAPFIAERWSDMYMHDAVWERGEAGSYPAPGNDGLGGTGIHAAIDTSRPGNGGYHVHGLCRDNLGGEGCPNGSPSGEPIANGWYGNVDWGGECRGDLNMRITGLPPGQYQMISYHNHWEPASQGSRNCLDKPSSMPPMPTVYARDFPPAGTMECMSGDLGGGPGGGVQGLLEAYNIKVTSELADADVATSTIEFLTDGSDVLIVYDGGDNSYPDPARPGREGSKAILNAFELIAEVPPPSVDSDGDGVPDRLDNCPTISNPNQEPCDQGCQCSGDLNSDGQVDLEDLQAVADILLGAGSPFIVPVEAGHCGNINNDEQIDLEDLQAVADILLAAGSPFIAQCP